MIRTWQRTWQVAGGTRVVGILVEAILRGEKRLVDVTSFLIHVLKTTGCLQRYKGV